MTVPKSGLLKGTAREGALFVVVGVVNTAVGFVIFWIANQGFGIDIQLANAMGYAVAILVAYQLNRMVVFPGRETRKSPLRFVLAFALAFAVNQAVIVFLAATTTLHPGVIQICGMVTYTILFFLFNKFVVFRAAEH